MMTRNKTLKIRRKANHRPFIALRVKRNKENSGKLAHEKKHIVPCSSERKPSQNNFYDFPPYVWCIYYSNLNLKVRNAIHLRP